MKGRCGSYGVWSTSAEFDNKTQVGWWGRERRAGKGCTLVLVGRCDEGALQSGDGAARRYRVGCILFKTKDMLRPHNDQACKRNFRGREGDYGPSSS
eukprot:scaffold297001_cov32-Tisochrysis_lutea.AAC.1